MWREREVGDAQGERRKGVFNNGFNNGEAQQAARFWAGPARIGAATGRWGKKTGQRI